MKVLILLLKGFEHMELAPFIDVFGWARQVFKADITAVTCGFDGVVRGAFGAPVAVDMPVERADAAEYAALAIPGGFGGMGYFEQAYDARAAGLIRAFDEAGRPIAAVCVAALALGRCGMLAGRRATTYRLEEGRWLQTLAGYGAAVQEADIVRDGGIITSSGPGTAAGVALLLLEELISAECAKKVGEAMGLGGAQAY